ncbi:MAG: hypothetical protein ACO3TW_04140 [Ilumatobacteraceae bacterium]|jgi:7-cyano-7-deazaguanine synthase in queuosine biosynthesis
MILTNLLNRLRSASNSLKKIQVFQQGESMKQIMKKTIVATATALLLSTTATAALADDATSPSTTVPKEVKTKSSEYSAAIAKYRTELKEYNDARKAIFKKFVEATKAANATRKSAREGATTKTEIKAVLTAFQEAISAATSERAAALAALGNPPAKPTK